jgi:hypothetical protein
MRIFVAFNLLSSSESSPLAVCLFALPARSFGVFLTVLTDPHFRK